MPPAPTSFPRLQDTLVSTLGHAVALQAAAARHGLQACIDVQDFWLQLRGPGLQQRWRPKFVARAGPRLVYVDQPCDAVFGFAGWSPYALRRWPTATDKGAFKQAAAQRDIATPAACVDPARIGGPFLVKRMEGSFGEGQRGPFLGYDAADPSQHLAEGEFYENFVPGTIAKAWCWGETCVALELRRPTTVTGDGQASLRALVGTLPCQGSGPDWLLVERLARYCGVIGLDEVVPAGHEILVEYRYGSRHAVLGEPSPNRLQAARDTGLAAQIDRAAQLLQDTIPAQQGLARSLFTLDAMVDAQGTAWFLEMNCNPLVHPDAYGPMLADAAAVAR